MNHGHFPYKDLSAAESLAYRAAEEIAPTLRENFGKTNYQTKSNERDWVTDWDIWAEERIINTLASLSRDIGFLSEEIGHQGNKDAYWTIDAIDGTSGYVRGIDTCTTMISLIDANRPVLALIYDFMRNTSYTAIDGHGAFKDMVVPLRTSSRPMSQAYIETYVRSDTEQGQRVNADIRKLGSYVLQTGAAGHMFASIARGSTEGFVSVDNPYATIWDYAPGALLVREAGGHVNNLGYSEEYTVDSADMVASNPLVYRTLLDIANA